MFPVSLDFLFDFLYRLYTDDVNRMFYPFQNVTIIITRLCGLLNMKYRDINIT